MFAVFFHSFILRVPFLSLALHAPFLPVMRSRTRLKRIHLRPPVQEAIFLYPPISGTSVYVVEPRGRTQLLGRRLGVSMT